MTRRLVGLIGPGWLLSQGISKPDYAISAGFSYNVTVAHNGCLHLEVRVEGKSAHAARPDTGVDALEAATTLLSSLYALRETYKTTRVFRAGHQPSDPGGRADLGRHQHQCRAGCGDASASTAGLFPEENSAEAEHDLTAHIARVCAGLPGIKVTIRRILLAEPFRDQAGAGKTLTALLQKHGAEIMGEDIPAGGVPIYTDARLYSEAGIPTVLYGAGPHTLLGRQRPSRRREDWCWKICARRPRSSR